jgi:hypothetical protein
MRPIHRPPRVPADRLPHCHWRVRIEPDATPAEEIPLTGRVRRSRLAQLTLPAAPAGGEPGGRGDYAGPFDPDLRLEDLAHPTLVAVCQEFCLQGHLLVRSFMIAMAERWGDAVAQEIAAHQWVGIAGLAAERIVAVMAIEGDGLDALAKLFQLHPAFHPRAYVALHVERTDDEVRCRIDDCEAFAEGDSYSWFALGTERRHHALDAMVRVVNPRARTRLRDVRGARLAWSVRIDPRAEALPEPPEVAVTKLSKGATFRFVPRHSG